MGVDLHFIGSGISSGDSHNGFGKIVSFPVAGGFPAAGTYAGTLYGVEYPIAEGGASLVNPVTSENVATQTCDVDQLNNGSGGVYTDWTSITNVQYYAFGVLFYTDTTAILTQTPIEVPSGSASYYDSEWSYQYYRHDGYGDVEQDEVWQYWADETFIVGDDSGYQLEVPSGSGNYFSTGRYDEIVWDGTGNYTTGYTYQGSFYLVGTTITNYGNDVEVPSGSSNFFYNGTGTTYYWDGFGGIGNTMGYGSYYANGTFITNDGTDDYYWDGTGGYYI